MLEVAVVFLVPVVRGMLVTVRAFEVSITDLVVVASLPSQLDTLAFLAAAAVAVLSMGPPPGAVVLVGVEPARRDLGSENTGTDFRSYFGDVPGASDPVDMVFGSGKADGLMAVWTDMMAAERRDLESFLQNSSVLRTLLRVTRCDDEMYDLCESTLV